MTRHQIYYKLIGKIVVPTDMRGAMVGHRVAETPYYPFDKTGCSYDHA